MNGKNLREIADEVVVGNPKVDSLVEELRKKVLYRCKERAEQGYYNEYIFKIREPHYYKNVARFIKELTEVVSSDIKIELHQSNMFVNSLTDEYIEITW